jgi:hypothetical protein
MTQDELFVYFVLVMSVVLVVGICAADHFHRKEMNQINKKRKK